MFAPVRTALFLFVILFVPILVAAAVILLIWRYNKKRKVPAGPSQYIRDDPPEMRCLGEVLKEHRARCNLTQERVAESLGVSRQAVGKWESGACEPSTANLMALARLYGVSADELLRGIKSGRA